MKVFDKDPDDQRRFCYCTNCGSRQTYNVPGKFASEDWPTEVFEKAVRRKEISRGPGLVMRAFGEG